MKSTVLTTRNPAYKVVVLVGLMLTMAFALFAVPSVSYAADTADGEVETPYTIVTNIRSGGEGVPGVTVTVEGDGYSGSAVTDEQGVANLGVPHKDATWTITLVADTIPEGFEAPEGFEFQREVTFGASNSATGNFILSAAERATIGFFDQLLERVINGLNFGLMLALAAIGLTLVYGTTGLANFAHGEMVTLGAVLALFFGVALNFPLWLAIILALAGSVAIGWGTDAGMWKPLRNRGIGLVQLMIVSIGLSLAMRYIFQIFMGGGVQMLPSPPPSLIPGLGPIRLSVIDVISMAISLVILVVFSIWIQRSRLGRATRAVSDNPGLAAASGINVDGVIRSVWIISSILAATSGILWAYFRPGVRWDMGTSILLLMFAAITLGGLGTAFGALIGSIIIGLLVEVSTLWLPSDLKYVGALGALIVILLVRPQGILGRKERIG